MKNSFLFLFLALQYTVYGQVASIQALKSSIDNYSAGHIIENAYIQYDKPVYNPGETIWFKAYILTAEGATRVSKNLYVDFIDTTGAILMHGVYPVQISAAAGNFDIPAKYRQRSIHVRAYTRWMLNFDSAFLYDKDIRIIQPPPPGSKPVAKPVTIAGVQFFPEGGDCIAGIKTKLAFKASYNNGMPANIHGTVVNSKGEVVDTFTTMHDGMGYFYLTAQPGETYTAQWQDEQGATYTTALPAVKTDGASLQLSQSKTNVGLLITRSYNAPATYTKMHIVAAMQQQAVYIAPVDLDKTTVSSGNIPLSQLSTGILQVTLLDSTWQPVAERIIFINKNDYSFKPAVHFDTTGIGKREKNVLVIDVPDTLDGNLSVSVTDAGVGTDSTDDIVARFMLTGQLKGNVYHPSQYFAATSDSVAQQLDLVMLTNGWRRFKINEIIAGTVPPLLYAADTNYLTLGGKVAGVKPGKQKQAASIMAIVTGVKPGDSAKTYLMMPINNDGTFAQPNFSFYDTLRVFYQLTPPKITWLNNNDGVTFSSALAAPKDIYYNKLNPIYNGVDTTGNYYNAMLAVQQARLAELLKQTTLQNVTVWARVKTRLDTLDESYTSGMFSGGANVSGQFDVLRDPLGQSAPDAFHYLLYKMPLLTFADTSTPSGFRNPGYALFINEVQRTVEDVKALSGQDIAYIKIFRPPSFVGNFGRAIGGAVAIYTVKGGEEPRGYANWGLPEKRVVGYTLTKEFYSPDYAIDSVMHVTTDIRSTLYWNPWVLITGKHHTARLPFYNNDITKKMRVVIEGIDGNGRLARVEKLVE